MEAAVGVVRPLETCFQSQQDHSHPNKRTRTGRLPSNANATLIASRARGSGMRQTGNAQRKAPEAKAFSSSSVTQPTAFAETSALLVAAHDTGLPTSSAYREPGLHGSDATHTDRSCHHPYSYASAVQHHGADPVVGSSGNGTGLMSIARVQPATESSFAPAAPSPSLTGGTAGQAYNLVSFQHQPQWPAPGQSGDINGHSHFQRPLQLHQQPLSHSHSVPSSFIAGPQYCLVVPPHIHQLTAEQSNALLPRTDVASSGHTSPLPTHLPGSGQPPTGIAQDSHLHHQGQQTFFQVHQASPTFNAGPVAVSPLPLPAVSYTTAAQLEAHGSHYPLHKPHTITLSPDSYFHSPMDGGKFNLGHEQPLEGSDSQPMDNGLNVQYVVPCYTVTEMTAGEVVPDLHNMHSYAEPCDGGNVDFEHGASHSPSGAHDEVAGGVDQESLHVSPENLNDADSSTQRNDARPTSSTKRCSLKPDERRQTAETRKMKACTRCRTQKMRCSPDPEDPTGPCVACKSFSKTSKKTIHLTPCFRGKITDVVLFRSGGLDLTRRWTGTEMKDVGDRINPGDIRLIKFTLGICDDPIVVPVVAFNAQPGDVTARYWTVREGESEVRKKKDLSQYCLADIHKTAQYFEEYVCRNAIPAMRAQRTGPVRIAGRDSALRGVIEKTYLAAIDHYYDIANSMAGTTDAVSLEKSLLENLFMLWFATRHTTGSSWICGKETLTMKPETKDETYPLFGKVSVPRMILAQFDSINHSKLLSKYGKRVLNDLENLIMRNQPRFWFTIYLSLFILLREASWMSEDRYRHARNNYGRNVRYSVPVFVESLQEGCNNLLQHWHYYNCKPWPDPAAPWDRHKSFLCELSSEQYHLVMETMTDPAVQKQLDVWRRYKQENGHVEKPAAAAPRDQETSYQGSQSQYDWDHPFYWISQLFEEQWHAHPTYQRECM